MARNTIRAARVKKTAKIRGCSTSKVYKVLSGERTDQETLNVYMDIVEKEEKAYLEAEQNHLLAAVKDLIPF